MRGKGLALKRLSLALVGVVLLAFAASATDTVLSGSVTVSPQWTGGSCNSQSAAAYIEFPKPAHFDRAYLAASINNLPNYVLFSSIINAGCSAKTFGPGNAGLWYNSCNNQAGSKIIATGSVSALDVTGWAKKQARPLFFFAGINRYTCPAGWTVTYANATDIAPAFGFSVGTFTQTSLTATPVSNVSFAAKVSGNASGTCVYRWNATDGVVDASVSSIDWDGVSAPATATLSMAGRNVSWACDFDAFESYALSIQTQPPLVTTYRWDPSPLTLPAGFSRSVRLVSVYNPTPFNESNVTFTLDCPQSATCNATTFFLAFLPAYNASFANQQADFPQSKYPFATPGAQIVTDRNAPIPKGTAWFSGESSTPRALSFSSEPSATGVGTRAFFVAVNDESIALRPGSASFVIPDGQNGGSNAKNAVLTSPDGQTQALIADSTGAFSAFFPSTGDWTLSWEKENGQTGRMTVRVQDIGVQAGVSEGVDGTSEPKLPNAPDVLSGQTVSAGSFGGFSFPIPSVPPQAAAAGGLLLFSVALAARKRPARTRVNGKLAPNGVQYALEVPKNGWPASATLRVLVAPNREVKRFSPHASREALMTGTLVEWKLEKPFGTANRLEFTVEAQPPFTPKDALPVGEIV